MTLISKQRVYAGLLFIGGSILFYRTLHLLSQNSLEILESWVNGLLFIEMFLDLFVMIFSIRWWIADNDNKDNIPLRFAAAATILHAIRVSVYVIGRIGPWINFDVKPEHRALHYTRWQIEWIWFAAIMSFFGILGVIIIWRMRRSTKQSMINVKAT